MASITTKQLALRIKNLRAHSGLSQEEFGAKIGLARQAVGQIEAGERDVSSIELAEIARFLEISPDSILTIPMKDNGQNPDKRCSGALKLKFDKDKLRNLLLYILARCGGKPNVGETVIYKLLYFIDFDSFELRSEPVTGMNYVRLQYGPVPQAKQYVAVIDGMVERKELDIISQVYGGMAQKKYVALVDPDMSVFKAEELRLMDGVVDRLSDLNASQIKNYAHHDVPWLETEPEAVIDYRLVFERTVPFAKTDHTALWQEAAGIDSIARLGKMPKEEEEYYENL